MLLSFYTALLPVTGKTSGLPRGVSGKCFPVSTLHTLLKENFISDASDHCVYVCVGVRYGDFLTPS